MWFVLQVWATSQYYNTPSRIIVFLKEIANMFIEKASAALDPETIFKGRNGKKMNGVIGVIGVIGVQHNGVWRMVYGA